MGTSFIHNQPSERIQLLSNAQYHSHFKISRNIQKEKKKFVPRQKIKQVSGKWSFDPNEKKQWFTHFRFQHCPAVLKPFIHNELSLDVFLSFCHFRTLMLFFSAPTAQSLCIWSKHNCISVSASSNFGTGWRTVRL